MQIKLRKVLALLSVLAMLCTMLPLGVFTATVSAADTPVNLIQNGDFEGGTASGWDSAASASASSAHTGSYGATAKTTSTWGKLFKQKITLEANTKYLMTFWYKANSDCVSGAGFELQDPNGIKISIVNLTNSNKSATSVSLSASATSWTQVRVQIVTGDQNYANTIVTFYGGGSVSADAPASFSVDDIVLNKLSSFDSMIKNGGFENQLDNWTRKYDDRAKIASDVTATGSYALQGTATKKYNGFVFQTVTVEANATYLVFFKAKAAISGGTARFYASTDGTNNTALNTTAYSFSASEKKWTSFNFTFNSGSNTSLIMFPAQGKDDGGDIYYDDIVMVKFDPNETPTDEPDEPTVKPDVPTDFGRVANGGFEDAEGGWTIKYANRTNADSYSGDYSLLTTSLKKYGVFAFTNIDVVPNSDYTISFKLKLAEQGTESKFRLYTRETSANDSGKTSVSQWDITDATTEWKTYTKVINSQELNTMYLSFAQGTDETAHTCSTFYIDDIILTGPIPGGDTPDEPSNDSLIVNGDFETGSKDPWTSGSSSAAITINSTNKHGGSYGAMVPARNRTFTARQDVTVKANTNYTVTFWYKSTDSAQEIHLLFGVYATDATASNATALATQVVLDNTKSDWTQVTYVFNTGDNTSVRVAFGSDNSSCLVKDYMYVDDIVMVEGGEIPDGPTEYVGSAQKDKTSGADIRFMTYNVLVGKDEANGGFSWGRDITGRPEKAFAMINYYKPDVIAFEEFSGEWYDAFMAEMSDTYEFTLVTNPDSTNNGSKLYTLLAYNKNTIRLLSTDLMKMEDCRWSNQGMRYVNIGFFEVIATGEKFIGAALHPDAGDLTGDQDLNGDGVAEEGDGYWRQFQLQQAAEYMAALSEQYQQPVLVGGDYNSGLNNMKDRDPDPIPYNKFVDAGFTDATSGRYIDHVFYNSMATHLYETTVSDAAVSGASDHDAVFADIQFLDAYATPIKNAKDYIKTQGRTTLKDGAMWLDFSASGIEFSANCEGKVALNLNVKSIKNTDATYGGLYFTVIVDGVTKTRAECRITSTGSVQLVLAENLPAGNHTFEVYRQTEHRGAEVGISSIVMEGTFNEKPADNRLYIEFIGDSISTGYGALGNGDTPSDYANSPLYQDATVAYPYLTAKALGADFSDVAYSGLGCKYGYSGSLSMQTVYQAQRYQYDQSTKYDFTKRQPDVVVIALGTNDIANQEDASLRKAGYQEMLDLVRAKNPNAKIVWIANMMKSTDNAMIEALIEENGGAAEGLYYLGLTQNTAGAGYHPSAAGQQKFADELVAFLNSDVLVRYVGDVMYDNQGGMANIYAGESHGMSSRMEMTSDELGLAFKFQINANGIGIKDGAITQADLTNATVDAFGDGTQYKLLAMGALVSNDPIYGMANMTREDAAGTNKVTDINATYLFDLEDDSAQFAMRITNIPLTHEATILYARAYYVFEYEGREITVYDDVFFANYIDQYESNDGAFEW